MALRMDGGEEVVMAGILLEDCDAVFNVSNSWGGGAVTKRLSHYSEGSGLNMKSVSVNRLPHRGATLLMFKREQL